MKYIQYILTIVAVFMLSACVYTFKEESAEESVGYVAEETDCNIDKNEMTRLRERLKVDQRHLKFEPPKNKQIFAGYRTNEEALSRLEKTLSLKNIKVKFKGDRIIGESDEFEISINIAQGLFFIVSKYKDIDDLASASVRRKYEIDNDTLFKKVERTVTQLGIHDAESGHLAYLGIQGKKIDGELEEPSMVSRKAFIDRSINEVPVLGNRLVLTYDLDGKFRKLVGRWTPINVKDSAFTVNMKKDELLSHVANAISKSKNCRIFIESDSIIFLEKAYIVGGKDKLLSEMNGPQPLKPTWVASMDSSYSDESGPLITEIIVAPDKNL